MPTDKTMKKLLYKLAMSFIAKTIINSDNKLTIGLLLANGWEGEQVGSKIFYSEPNIKERDKVWIEFEKHYYRVWHGRDRTFIALESSVEWLQLYLLAIDKHSHAKSRPLKKPVTV